MCRPTPSRARARALSLVETVISVFLLLCACLVVVALFHSSLRYSSRIIVQSAAARVAEEKLAEVRSFARQLGRDFTSTTLWNNQYPGTATLQESFQVLVQHASFTVYSPCSKLEEQYSGDGDTRRLTNSFRKVTITVSWLPNLPGNQVAVTSLVGAPPLTGVGPVTVDSDDLVGNLDFNKTITFTARLSDGSADVVPDVMFAWAVLPGAGAGTGQGNGIIDPNHPDTRRSGQRATFRNNYPLYSDPWGASVKGRVSVMATCRYRGIPYAKRSASWNNQ